MKAVELARETYASADADQGCECAFVECERSFVPVDRGCGIQGGLVLIGRLQADFDDVFLWSGNVPLRDAIELTEGLAEEDLCNSSDGASEEIFCYA